MFSDQQVPSMASCLNEQEFYNNFYVGGYYNLPQQYYPYDLSSSNWMARPQPLEQNVQSDSNMTFEQCQQQQQEQYNFYYNQMQQHYLWNAQAELTEVKPPAAPPAPRPSSTPSDNPKRKRTCFNTYQLMQLEETFQNTPYISSQQRRQMAAMLQLEEKSVKCWFQNRRMKKKKERAQMTSATSSPTSTTSSTVLDNEDLVRRLLKHAVKRNIYSPESPEGEEFKEYPEDTSSDALTIATDGEDAESVDNNLLDDQSFY